METVKENVAAFDKFYADNVVMQENMNGPVHGMAANRLNEEAFVNGITEFRGAGVKEVVYNDDLAVVQWHFDFDHRGWGTRKYDQLSSAGKSVK